MSVFSFNSRGWGSGAHVKVTFIPEVTHYPTSNADPIVYATRTWTVLWGDGATSTGTASSNGGTINVTHDYGSDIGPRTLVVTTDTDSISEFRVTGAGLTSLSGTLFTTLLDCQTFDFSHNFLVALPSGLNVHEGIVTFDVSYNNFTGTTPTFSDLARLNNVNLSHNGYDTMGDIWPYFALLTFDVSYNPISSYLGTLLPHFLRALRVQHCKFDQNTIDLFGSQLEAHLSDSNTIIDAHTASITGSPTVVWIDRVYDPPPGLMHVTLPWDGSAWPDPAIIGSYNIQGPLIENVGADNYKYAPDIGQRITVVSKSVANLVAEVVWRDTQFCIYPISNASGQIESENPSGPPNWNPPNGTEFWQDHTFISGSSTRGHQAEGGENAVPSTAGQASWDAVRASSHYVTSGINPPYNTVSQNSSHPRVVAQLGGGGVDYSRVGWMGKRYISGTADGDTPDMQTVRFAHIMSGIAVARKALVVVWYSGLGTMAGDHVDSIKLNGTDLTRLGPTIHETNPVASPFNLESFLSDQLPDENMMELVFHLDAAASQIAFTVGFVRDAGPVTYTDRPVADTDPVIGRTNWDVLTQAPDIVLVAAASRFAGNTFTPIHSDGQFQAVPQGSGNDITDQWTVGDQNDGLGGNTMLYKTGVRPEGTGGAVSNWYWTHAATADWTTVGGAARAFIFGHKPAGRVRALIID